MSSGASSGARGSCTPDVPVRAAATVVLLRDHRDGLQTWLLTRVTQMVFAAGMSVFPGGRVDPDDAALPMQGVDLDGVAVRLRCDRNTAAGLLGAAVREVFEETGVLLCTPPAALGAHRAEVERGVLGFGALLREHGLACDPGGLAPWDRWITPAGEVRRYDTRFFLAELPDGVDAADLSTESSEAGWVTIRDALAQAEAGSRMLMPPTRATLISLLPFSRAGDALAAAPLRRIEAVRPLSDVGPDGAAPIRLGDASTHPLPRRPLPRRPLPRNSR